jgi:hypothetical protein
MLVWEVGFSFGFIWICLSGFKFELNKFIGLSLIGRLPAPSRAANLLLNPRVLSAQLRPNSRIAEPPPAHPTPEPLTSGPRLSSATSTPSFFPFPLPPSLTATPPLWKGPVVWPWPPPWMPSTRPRAASVVHPTYRHYKSTGAAWGSNPSQLGFPLPNPPPATSRRRVRRGAGGGGSVCGSAPSSPSWSRPGRRSRTGSSPRAAFLYFLYTA